MPTRRAGTQQAAARSWIEDAKEVPHQQEHETRLERDPLCCSVWDLPKCAARNCADLCCHVGIQPPKLGMAFGVQGRVFAGSALNMLVGVMNCRVTEPRLRIS